MGNIIITCLITDLSNGGICVHQKFTVVSSGMGANYWCFVSLCKSSAKVKRSITGFQEPAIFYSNAISSTNIDAFIDFF